MAKTDSGGFITWNGASCVEKPPIWTSRVTALKKEATGLVFMAILTMNSSKNEKKRGKKSLKLFLSS